MNTLITQIPTEIWGYLCIIASVYFFIHPSITKKNLNRFRRVFIYIFGGIQLFLGIVSILYAYNSISSEVLDFSLLAIIASFVIWIIIAFVYVLIYGPVE